MKDDKVFYSWQSDLPNSINRGFIQKALENAAKTIRNDDSIKVEPVIDRDTQGVPGSPDISNAIFEKIEQSQIFVCDVSIINKHLKFRKTPNPNVLIELGYAIKTLGQERIVMVMNTVFGKPESLPFDLNKKRVVTYYMPEQSNDRTKERKELKLKLEKALRTIFANIETSASSKETVVARVKKYLVDERYKIELDDLIVQEIRKAIDLTSKSHVPLQISDLTTDIIIKRLGKYEEIFKPLCSITTVLCYYGNEKHRKLIQNIITKIAENSTKESGLTIITLKDLRWYPVCLLLYNGGIASIASEKYENLFSLFTAVGPDPEYRKKTENVLVQMVDAIDKCEGLFKMIPEYKHKYSRSKYMYDNLQANLDNLIFPGNNYEHLFDTYELFQKFVFADLANCGCGPIGRFERKQIRRRDTLVTDYIEDAKKQGNMWPPIKAGLFRSDINRFNEISGLLLPKLNNLP